MPTSVGSVTQLKLFELEADQDRSVADDGKSFFCDPSFASNKTQAIHRWVPWIAGFASDFVRDVLHRYLDSAGTVLDPFAGVGTTLVEAMLLGHKAVGFEINPYAAQVCKAKVNACRIPTQAFYDEISDFWAFYQDKISSNYTPKSTSPKGFRTRSEFYSPQVLHKVLIVLDFIQGVKNSDLGDLFKLAFAATMVQYSNYSYEPSLGRRASAGKPEIQDFPVGQTISNKLTEMVQDISWLQDALPDELKKVSVVNDSFFKHQHYLAAGSIDLIITSPPYLNNYHYNRNTRPQLYWLGYVSQPRDLAPFEHANFGKYWQTVRDQDSLELEFSLPGTDLEQRLQLLRTIKVDKGIYGGNGWANYAASYFNDCYRFAQAIKHLLKPGATALVVVGNSILQGIMMPTDQYLAKIAESVGLELLRIDVPRANRVGSSIIQSDVRVVKAKKSDHLYEAIVELRKL